jgi:hypothetical protein
MITKKVVIGIHGLGNKPPKKLLKKWWKNAIREGLKRIGHPRRFFKFEIVYWAHYLHPKPLNPRIKDPKNPLYLEHPYVPAHPKSVTHTPSLLKKKVLDILEKILDRIFLQEHRLINVDKISDLIISLKFEDLKFYYDRNVVEKTKTELSAKEAIRQELVKAPKRHKHKKILLIAHSMGCIIAYDVLTQEVPDIKIHTFITLGSPLGLPAIMKKIATEQNIDLKQEKKVPTPENLVKSWVNFSDLDDNIAINYNLADDYKENSHNVGPEDFMVHNDYEYKGIKNHHKSFGYLRAPEVAEVIHRFLSEEKRSPVESLRNRIKNLFRNVKHK